MPDINEFLGIALQIGIAVLILIGGWILALIVASVVRGAMGRTDLDNKLAAKMGVSDSVNIEGIVSRVVFWLVMLLVVVASLQLLNLTAVTQPINRFLGDIFAYGSNLLGAGALLLLAWILASVLYFIITKALGATKLDDMMSEQVGLATEGQKPLSETLANIVYWFVFLFFLPGILGALGMQGVLGPVQNMVDDLLGALPSILEAGIIFLIGWFVARLVRQIVTSFLSAVGADSLGERMGMSAVVGSQSLSAVIGTVVYSIILIVVSISALDALQIEAISGPATNMLETFLAAIPAIFGAIVILAFTYFIAQLIAGLVTNLLTTVGFNRVLSLIGIGSEPEEGQRTPSEIVGHLVTIALMLFAVSESASLLGFGVVEDLVSAFLVFASQIILGIIVLGIGLYLANLAAGVVRSTAGPQAHLLSQVTRIAIIILTTAMGLRQMGIADEIVTTAFTLLLGAIAVAVALAFGLGARETAAREVESVLQKLRSDDN